MSVYTVIDASELRAFLGNYDVGDLVSFEGISSGIENTNYFVSTERGEFVLTIFEQHKAKELSFFLDLTAYLSEHDIPCAHPIADNNSRYLEKLKNKPAALVQRLDGKNLEKPNGKHCAQVGLVLAQLHVASRSFEQKRDNTRGPHWWRQAINELQGHISSEDNAILSEEINYQASFARTILPQAIIHADLFRDNVLFHNDKLSGLIDFYYACSDALLYDLAVTINDWCVNTDGSLDEARTTSLVEAYQSVRKLDKNECAAYTVMLRAGALRFWLSRLYDLHFPRKGEMTHTKDPDAFKRILLQHRESDSSSWLYG